MTEWLAADDPLAPVQVAEVIKGGGLVILPTDTVYGVAADLWNHDAVATLYAAKQRSPDRAIPILLADPENIEVAAQDIPAMAQRLAAVFWPGPLTLVVPKHPHIPEIVSALPTVGVRVPDHDAARAAIHACGGALAVTSANLSGQSAPLTAKEAAQALGETIALVLDGGPCPGGTASTVVEIRAGEIHILRPGPLDAQTLQQAMSK